MNENTRFHIAVCVDIDVYKRQGLRLAVGCVYGDLVMRVLYATRPYEKVPGTCQAILDKWHDKIIHNVIHFNRSTFYRNLKGIVSDFDNVERTGEKKPKVGVVGEILVKYLSLIHI